MKIIIICILFVLISCNREKKYYYSNGNISAILSTKMGTKTVTFKSYYQNGNIEMTGSYKNKKENGWWYFYDSLSRKESEKYYYNGDNFTDIEFDKFGKCKRAIIRPRILYNSDTMYLNVNDSIPIIFFQKNKVVNIKEYIITVLPDSDTTTDAYVIVYPIRNKNSYFYASSLDKKNILYYIEIKAFQTQEEPLCCCDSVICDVSAKYVYIK